MTRDLTAATHLVHVTALQQQQQLLWKLFNCGIRSGDGTYH